MWSFVLAISGCHNSILARQGKLSRLIASKPTSAFQMYYLVWTCSLPLFTYQPCATGPLVTCLYKGIVKIVDSGLYFISSFHFLFHFHFLFLEQLGLGLIGHTVTSVTSWWRSHKTDHETWENIVEGTRTKWRHTTWTLHVGLMHYSWSFRVGCIVVSTDHGD